MIYSARTLALLLAVFIALVTVLFLSLVDGAQRSAMVVAGLVSFSSSYLLIYVVLEFLVFREINRIYKILGKVRKKELRGIEENKSGAVNPLKNIHEEIYSFALLKQKEIDELKKLEAFRRDFIANVSHELKTPVFAAQGFIHTLLDGAMKDKSVRNRFLKKAAKSLDGLDMLLQDLLTLSQIETGGIKMKFASIDIVDVCSEVIDQLEERAEKKDIRIKLANAKEKLLVYADGQRISQVVSNLVSNAINYTPEGGEVTLSFEVGKKNVTLLVRDTGEGIPAEHLPRIFERFYRVDQSRSREKGGTGLGLAIVKHILEGHGTRAEVESVLGKGSVFSFKLPRATGEGGKE
ncbi:MAG: ATP-binding protein [Cytophagales bacterium]|nr:ATP-binding protein [Cytophagales bacterium]